MKQPHPSKDRNAPPPSRRRYDERNPVFSMRMTRAEYDQLRALCRRTCRSAKAIFLTTLEGHSPLLRGTYITDEKLQSLSAQAVKAGREQGYREGFARARAEFAVEVPCSSCSLPLGVRGPQAIAVVAEALIAARLEHEVCPSLKPTSAVERPAK